MKWETPVIEDFNCDYVYNRHFHAAVRPQSATVDTPTPSWEWEASINHGEPVRGVQPTCERALEAARWYLLEYAPDILDDLETEYVK